MVYLAEQLIRWTDVEIAHALRCVRPASDYGKALTRELARRRAKV